MKLDESTEFEVTAGGFQAVARLGRGGLLVSVKRRMFVLGENGAPTTWRWFFVSDVFVYFPTPKSDAIRTVGNHLALYDQQLPPTIVDVWNLWDTFGESTEGSAPAQSKEMN